MRIQNCLKKSTYKYNYIISNMSIYSNRYNTKYVIIIFKIGTLWIFVTFLAKEIIFAQPYFIILGNEKGRYRGYKEYKNV